MGAARELYERWRDVDKHRWHHFEDGTCAWCGKKRVFPTTGQSRPFMCQDCGPRVPFCFFLPTDVTNKVPVPRAEYYRKAIRRFAGERILPEVHSFSQKGLSVFLPRAAVIFLQEHYKHPSIAVRGCIVAALLVDKLLEGNQ